MLKTLKDYQAWRRGGAESYPGVNLIGDAIDWAIDELELPNWISVEDELPEKDYENVLCYCEGGNIEVTKFHSDRMAFKWDKANHYTRKCFGKLSGHFQMCHERGYKVTHWMPLPKPPEQTK